MEDEQFSVGDVLGPLLLAAALLGAFAGACAWLLWMLITYLATLAVAGMASDLFGWL